jgi:hypothetical protein
MVDQRRSETWSTDNVTPLRPQRAPPAVEDADAPASFTEDQVETLGYALAGVKTELSDAFDESLATTQDAFEARLTSALAAAKADLLAELEERLDTARSAARDDLRAEFEQRLERTIKVFREEIELTVAAVRSEVLAKIDRATYGLMLTDIDPRSLERAIGELKVETAERLQAAAARIDGLANGLEARAGSAELGQLRRDVELLQSRLSTARRRIDELVKDAKIDAANYRATLVLANGSDGPTLDLRPMFQQFFDDTKGGR